MIKNIYCPVCLKNGKRKLLFRCDSETKGIVYSFCKVCKKEYGIDVNEPYEPVTKEKA